MGAYPTEGVTEAGMKDHHAERIAKLIYKAAGRDATKIKVARKK
jgi:hypothetical protein